MRDVLLSIIVIQKIYLNSVHKQDLDPFDDVHTEIRVIDDIGDIMTKDGQILKLN